MVSEMRSQEALPHLQWVHSASSGGVQRTSHFYRCDKGIVTLCNGVVLAKRFTALQSDKQYDMW